MNLLTGKLFSSLLPGIVMLNAQWEWSPGFGVTAMAIATVVVSLGHLVMLQAHRVPVSAPKVSLFLSKT